MFSRQSSYSMMMSSTLGTSSTDHDDSPLDIVNKDIVDNDNDNDNDNDSDNMQLSIDPIKKDMDTEENDIVNKLQILHDMILIKFSLLDEKNQREFNELKRMMNPSYDSPRRYVHNNKPLSSPLTSDDDTVDYINVQDEVPPIIINKQSYFKSFMKALKRKVKKVLF